MHLRPNIIVQVRTNVGPLSLRAAPNRDLRPESAPREQLPEAPMIFGKQATDGAEVMKVQCQDIADTFSVNTSLTGAWSGHALEGAPSHESED